jgi:hypothetical protein
VLAARFVRARVVGFQDLGKPRNERVDALAQRFCALFLECAPDVLEQAPGQLCIAIGENAVG